MSTHKYKYCSCLAASSQAGSEPAVGIPRYQFAGRSWLLAVYVRLTTLTLYSFPEVAPPSGDRQRSCSGSAFRIWRCRWVASLFPIEALGLHAWHGLHLVQSCRTGL